MVSLCFSLYVFTLRAGSSDLCYCQIEINFFFFLAGRHSPLRCMGNLGICRASCKKNEQAYLSCRNYQPCCLQSYVRIDIFGKEGKNDWSRENRWPKISWVLVISILNPLSILLIKIHAPAILVCLSSIGNQSERLGFEWWDICPLLDPDLWERKLEKNWSDKKRGNLDRSVMMGRACAWVH